VRDVAAAVSAVRARIERAGGDPDAITIVGAKPPDIEACRAALAAGVVDLGENRAQELLAKAPALDGVRWHFIGRLQTNKVRAIAEHVALWETLDRAGAIDEVATRAPGADVLVQVNISDESQKGGCAPSSTGDLVQRATDVGLRVIGLMGIGPMGDPEAARPGFRTLRGLADDLGLAVRSMGMTNDLEVAVQEGATMVRIGTALFGPRR
jgi:pyridoxal phosphate enzyme (YggS family)